eukprot:scaffold154_cov286-Pinguiococcus_pyrenoidosus.AAC.8
MIDVTGGGGILCTETFPIFVRNAAKTIQTRNERLKSTDKLVRRVTASVIKLNDLVTKLNETEFNPNSSDFERSSIVLKRLVEDVKTWTGFPGWQRRSGWSRTERCVLAYKFGLKFQSALLQLAEFEQKLLLAVRMKYSRLPPA